MTLVITKDDSNVIEVNVGTFDSAAATSILASHSLYGLTLDNSADASAARTILERQDFSTRAAFVTWASGKTPTTGLVMRADGVAYRYIGTGTDISDLPGWVPDGQVTDDHFNGDIRAMRTYLDTLANTEHGIIRGAPTHTLPILTDSDRSASMGGTTRMSNINEPGSITLYTGTGISKTIASATNANPAVFTITAHGFTAGERVWAKDTVGGTWAATLNGGPWVIGTVTTNTVTLLNDSAVAINGTTLGTLTGGTLRNEGAMGAYVLGGSFMQSYEGLAMRTNKAVESIVTINAENSVNSDDFSGSITRFSGIQFAPQTLDVTKAQVLIANHKFATFDNCWWIKGTSSTPALIVGSDKAQSPNTLMAGVAAHTAIRDSFVFSNILLENAENFAVTNTQFDGTSYPTRLGYSGSGVAEGILVASSSLINDGGATGTGLPAITQAPMDASSPALPFTTAWNVNTSVFRDWPIGIQMGAGWMDVRANAFRGREAGNIGIVIGEYASGENISHDNNFLQMIANGNQGILDLRVKDVVITGISLTNPVVVTCAGGHQFNDGDRARIVNVGGTVEVNSKEFLVQGSTSTTFQLYSVDDNAVASAAVNGTAYTAYTSGGTVSRPYHWHRQAVGGYTYTLGHGSFVFDLALDQLTTLASGSNNVLTLNNVPIVGGFYEVTYGMTVQMLAVTGTVKFALTVAGTSLADTQSAFVHTNVTANEEVHHSFSKVVYIPPQTNANGTQLRLNVNAPGAIRLRGKASGSLGQTFMQIRKVS